MIPLMLPTPPQPDIVIRDLDDAINSLQVDSETIEKLRNQLKEIQEAAKAATQAELQRQQQEFELRILKEKSQYNTQRLLRLLNKDLVSVVIGGILLVFMSVAMLVLIGNGKVEARLFENAFLILLGFFFGQGASSRVQKVEDV